MNNPRRTQTDQGFTLLEVLIALVILAVTAAGLTKASMQAVQQGDYLTTKTLASVVAVNKIREMQLSETWPDIGRVDDSVELGGRSWTISTDVAGTDVKSLRRVQIRVNLAGEKDSSDIALYLLTGYVGEH